MLISTAPPLVLASASPRRRDLLAEHGYPFVCEPAHVREISPRHLTPGEIVIYNARAKAMAIARRRPDDLILGVDTVVVFEHQILGKPRDMDDALSMLRQLNGHE